MFGHFDIIVIGGGHAGVEAAWAAANALSQEPTRRIALITLDASKIGVMSCNPAIGGLAKGQLVREIDALGGLMGLATDATGIQFRILNTSKGPAVHGPRAQCDKHAYALAVQALIASRPSITVIQGSVEDIVTQPRTSGSLTLNFGPALATAVGVRLHNASIAHLVSLPPAGPTPPGHSQQFAAIAPGVSVQISTNAVVLTTGTFMRGLMHTGKETSQGGRFGEAAAVGISAALARLGFELGRLKTGTPPRLKRSSIDWDSLKPQLGDSPPVPFSDLSGTTLPADCNITTNNPLPTCAAGAFPHLPQVDCRQTRTDAAAHQLIRDNLHLAPMYSGQIQGVGPRYCPSLEDKVVRFSERESHGVFLEPESLRDDWIYCNGISTSLPAHIQDQIVRTMPGCEQAEIYRYGYAVEYDMVRPHQITAAAMTRSVAGLFLAGQINGTSGYEEAAAQGLVAGLNAALLVLAGNDPAFEPYIFTRDTSYIGVMMDDLVTKTPTEPYRMFTSRAEHRLLLRSDNAAERLTPIAARLGLLNNPLGLARQQTLKHKQDMKAELNALIDVTSVEGQPLAKRMRADLFTLEDLASAVPQFSSHRPALLTVLADRRYHAYIIRQHAEIKRQADLEHRKLPEHVNYESLTSLRAEARHALARFKPATFGQASRLEGITPADITILTVLIKRHPRDPQPPALPPNIT